MLDRGPRPWRTEPPGEIGIKGIGYYLGERFPISAIPELAADPQALVPYEKRGFRHYTRSPVEEPEMAVRSCRETLRRSGLCAGDIDAVVFGWTEHRFYNDMQERLGTHLVRELGFHATHVLGIFLAGCALTTELLRTARNLIVGEGYRNVLIVEANRCNPDDSDRAIPPDQWIYSDGASSCIVTADRPEFALRSAVHITQALPDYRTVGYRSSFVHKTTNSHATLMRAMRHAQTSLKGIRQFFMPNASPAMVHHHARMMRIPLDRVYMANVPAIGHPWSADTLINLYSYCHGRTPAPGDLFAALAWAEGGFGSFVLQRTAHPMTIEAPDFPPVLERKPVSGNDA